MKRFFSFALPITLAWLSVSTPASSAERYALESKHSLKATLAVPAPDGKALEKDVDQAIAEITARKRDDDLVRELVLTPRRRPDLDYDVVTGIQMRNIENALRRR